MTTLLIYYCIAAAATVLLLMVMGRATLGTHLIRMALFWPLFFIVIVLEGLVFLLSKLERAYGSRFFSQCYCHLFGHDYWPVRNNEGHVTYYICKRCGHIHTVKLT